MSKVEQEPLRVPLRLDPSVVHDPRGGRRVPAAATVVGPAGGVDVLLNFSRIFLLESSTRKT